VHDRQGGHARGDKLDARVVRAVEIVAVPPPGVLQFGVVAVERARSNMTSKCARRVTAKRT